MKTGNRTVRDALRCSCSSRSAAPGLPWPPIRPETRTATRVTWVADHAAQSDRDAASDLAAIDAAAADLRKAGPRRVGSLQALDIDAVRAAIADGTMPLTRIACTGGSRGRQAIRPSQRRRWQIGRRPPPRGSSRCSPRLMRPQSMARQLGSCSSRARTAVAALIDDLQRHDGPSSGPRPPAAPGQLGRRARDDGAGGRRARRGRALSQPTGAAPRRRHARPPARPLRRVRLGAHALYDVLGKRRTAPRSEFATLNRPRSRRRRSALPAA